MGGAAKVIGAQAWNDWTGARQATIFKHSRSEQLFADPPQTCPTTTVIEVVLPRAEYEDRIAQRECGDKCPGSSTRQFIKQTCSTLKTMAEKFRCSWESDL